MNDLTVASSGLPGDYGLDLSKSSSLRVLHLQSSENSAIQFLQTYAAVLATNAISSIEEVLLSIEIPRNFGNATAIQGLFSEIDTVLSRPSWSTLRKVDVHRFVRDLEDLDQHARAAQCEELERELIACFPYLSNRGILAARVTWPDRLDGHILFPERSP